MAVELPAFLTNIFGYGQPLDIILNVVLPIPILAYAFYLFLGEIRIIKSSTARVVLGIVLSAILVLEFRFGLLAVWGGIAGILIFKMKTWPSRIIGLIIFLFFVSQITNLSLSGLNPQQILLVIFLGFGLFSLTLTSDQGLWKQLIILAVIFIFYYIIISYIPLGALQARI